jgi:hypothetical protein
VIENVNNNVKFTVFYDELGHDKNIGVQQKPALLLQLVASNQRHNVEL